MERAIYNGIISGMSLDGTSFFYVNPLEVDPVACKRDFHKSHVKPQRQKWFGCACCPPNVARLLSSIASYAYETDEDTLYINLFMGGDIHTTLNGHMASLSISTHYPWEETVSIRVTDSSANRYTMAIRIPGWCKEKTFSVNGCRYRINTDNTISTADAQSLIPTLECHLEKGYLYLTKEWNTEDTLVLSLGMPVERIQANPNVREDIGKCAIMRGPLVYCLEEKDNGPNLHRIYLSSQPDFHVTYQPDLLGGVCTIETTGSFLTFPEWEESHLYQTYQTPSLNEKKLTFIPYYAWANRGLGEMLVWVRV